MQHSHSRPPSGAGVRTGPVLSPGDNRTIALEGLLLVEEGSRRGYMARRELGEPVWSREVEGSSWSLDSTDSPQAVSVAGARAGMEGLKGTMKGRSHRRTLGVVSLPNQHMV
jgi:hypothetical protein